MHPYGPSGDACDDFEKSDRVPEFHSTLTAAEESLVVSELRVEVKAMTRSFLREYYPYLSEQTFFLGLGTSSRRLAVHFVAGLSIVPGASLYRAHADAQKSLTEWRSLKESGTLRAWIEVWLEEEISNLQMTGALPLPNSGSAISEEFWQNIWSALAQCFPGSGKWSCRKVEREYLADNNLYAFETRSPSRELVRFQVAAHPDLPREVLLRELIRGIQRSAEITRASGQYSFLFEDRLALPTALSPWDFEVVSTEHSQHFPERTNYVIECKKGVRELIVSVAARNVEDAIALAKRAANGDVMRGEVASVEVSRHRTAPLTERWQRSVTEPPRGGRILPPATIVRRTFYRPIPGTDRGYCDN